jgi:hypothetical protein
MITFFALAWLYAWGAALVYESTDTLASRAENFIVTLCWPVTLPWYYANNGWGKLWAKVKSMWAGESAPDA